MTAKQHNERVDAIFEAVIRAAAKEAMKDETKALPPMNQLNAQHEPSDFLSAKINAIINKEAASLKRQRIAALMGRNVASIALIFIIGTASVFVALDPTKVLASPSIEFDMDYSQDIVYMDMNVPPDDNQKEKDNKGKKLSLRYRNK